MRNIHGIWLAPSAILAVSALAGCGGGGGGSSSGGITTTAGGAGTTAVGATMTVGSATAAAANQIPATTPASTGYTGLAYSITGVSASVPGVLTITYPASDAASGTPVIYEVVNGAWVAVSGNAAGSAADTATAAITQPGIYGLLTPTPLTAPALTATGGDPASSGNVLTWTSAGSGSITYNIYRATASQSLSVTSADQIATVSSGTTYTDTSAQATTTYDYAISAVSSSASTVSVVSNEASATPGVETNSQYISGAFVLNGSSSGNTVSLSITLNHAPQASDLKSIQIQGTTLAVNAGVSVSGNTITYTTTLPSQYTPLTSGQYYSITANVATTAGGSTTVPLELSAPDTSATGSSDTAIGNFTFDINS